jgi:putative phosphoribosyl transferase
MACRTIAETIGYLYEEVPVPLVTRSRPIPVPAPGGEGERMLELQADLTVPPEALACVAFAHGSGSGRLSPRNRQVAGVLNDAGLATLLLDLLTPREEGDRRNVFDVELLAARLARATRWLEEQPETRDLAPCYFGASTGAAAALRAAGTGTRVRAVVSRGGRPDLAGPCLADVRSPTLLIVGSLDDAVLSLNREALAALRCEAELAVVPGATHLFEEPGTLEQVAVLARDWFLRHLERSG